MKISFLLCILLFVGTYVQAQRYEFYAERKDGRTTRYRPGTALRVRTPHMKEKKYRGMLVESDSAAIYLASFPTWDTVVYRVPLSEIEVVVPLSRKGRQTMGIIAGGGAVLTGALFLFNQDADGLESVVYLVPALIAYSVLYYGIPITFLTELGKRKTTTRGWKFITQQGLREKRR